MPAKRRRPTGWQGEELKPSKLEEAAEIARKAGDWSLEKLAILDYYVGYGRGGFLNASQKAVHRYYVDGYAGSGKIRAGKTGPILDGSPLIALGAGIAPSKTAVSTTGGLVRFTRCFLVEASRELESVLRKRLEKEHPAPTATAGRAQPRSRWDLRRGNFNELASAIFGEIEPNAPILAFLDLEDLDDLDFKTLQHIAGLPRKKRVELFITLPVGRIGQAAPQLDAVMKHLGRTTGDPAGVAAIFSSYPTRAQINWPEAIAKVVALFRKQLLGLGYKHVLEPHPSGPRNYPINFLIYASDDDVGATLMKAAFNPETRRRRELQTKLEFS